MTIVKSVTESKNVKGGPFRAFIIHAVAKYQTFQGDPLVQSRNFRKNVSELRKKSKVIKPKGDV